MLIRRIQSQIDTYSHKLYVETAIKSTITGKHSILVKNFSKKSKNLCEMKIPLRKYKWIDDSSSELNILFFIALKGGKVGVV